MKLGGKRVMAFTLLVLTVFLPCQAEAYGISGQVLEKTTQIPIEGAVLSFEKKELVSEKMIKKFL